MATMGCVSLAADADRDVNKCSNLPALEYAQMLNVCQVSPETQLCMIFLIIRPVLSSLTFAERLVFPSSLRSAIENLEENGVVFGKWGKGLPG